MANTKVINGTPAQWAEFGDDLISLFEKWNGILWKVANVQKITLVAHTIVNMVRLLMGN